MKENLIEKFLAAVLVTVMAFNAFMLIGIWKTINTDAVFQEKKAIYALPNGFTAAGTNVVLNKSLPLPSGWVVRYVSKDCIYCELDFEWERLALHLEKHNYRTILLLAKEAGQFEKDQIVPETAQQLVFIRMDWIKQFRLTETPTVIIFNNDGRVLWSHRGMLEHADYKSAEKVIARNVKHY